MVEMIQFAASLVAILALAWLVRRLKLGATQRIEDVDHAAQIARSVIYGFEAQDAAIGRGGDAALLRDAGNRFLLLFAHGSRFAGRLLTSGSEVRLNEQLLEITPADSAIGTIRLDLGEQAQQWAASLRRLNRGGEAPANA